MLFEIKRGLLLLFVAWVAPLIIHAQFSLPSFDVDLKGSIAVIPSGGGKNFSSSVGDIENIQLINVSASAHWQLNQNIGIGWLYCRSVDGGVSTHLVNGGNARTSDAFLLMNGPDIRISTGRTKNWRPYLSLNYCQMELVNDKVGYRLASKTNAIGGSIGIMRRLSNKIYLNVIELSYHMALETPFWPDLNGKVQMLEAKTGLTVNFGKRK